MLSRREALQLGTLLLCVPAQYLLLVSVPSVLECTHAVLQATSALRAVRSSLLGWMFPLTGAGGEDGAEAQESPAIEVLQLRERAGHWASSPEPRLLRPSHLLYRVGQAVRHRALGFRAVVVGWDLRAKAPETWLRNQHRGDQAVCAGREGLPPLPAAGGPERPLPARPCVRASGPAGELQRDQDSAPRHWQVF
ncbi:uncharacterized protein LOC134542132 isoform X3 [Bacillus rossius redtenbacheri]|uniref:uncharacterized protein LOC134542132 isoform X3 n=1 Tax=Bacillus rossius redtenbacheri TaxID=93214 RepID=UPI002FDEA647